MNISHPKAVTVWQEAIRAILENGKPYKDNDGRTCIEILGMMLTITDSASVNEPITRLAHSDKWIYPELSEISSVMLSKSGIGYAYSYGKRLFAHSSGQNQIDNYVIPILQADPNSRRAVAILFDVARDSDVKSKQAPSMLSIDFKLREGKLHTHCFIRSLDVFIGWPANVFQLHAITEYVAKRLNVSVGSLTLSASSAHVFLENKADMQKIANL